MHHGLKVGHMHKYTHINARSHLSIEIHNMHNNMPTDKQTSIQTNMQTVLPFSAVTTISPFAKVIHYSPTQGWREHSACLTNIIHLILRVKAAENVFENRKYYKK